MRSITKLFVILFSNLIFAQNTFKIKLSAPLFENDSLSIQPAAGTGNAEKIYNFTVESSPTVSFEKDFNSVTVRIKGQQTIIDGNIDYPQLVIISYYDPKINGGYMTKPFFIEKGDFIISVNRDKKLGYHLETNSPANLEHQKLRLALESFNKNLKPYTENDAKDLQAKQIFLAKYIKNNPNSFVAFWEIVWDFSRFGFDKSQLKNLSLFSKKIKNSYSYIEFKKIMDTENSTNIGGNFPNIIFENNEKITKSDFAKYKLTLIDYWSTTCKPCIEDLPKLVGLCEKYKDKNVNFISISDDIQKEKMDLAEKILKKNNVEWKNYFDKNKEFPRKLNASGYPLQILVDSNGKIVERKLGELDQIEEAIENYVK